jgi:hypothetical protein
VSRASIVARGRAAAEAGMVDACTIRRRTGSTIDDNTGQVTPTWADVYAGRCRIQQRTVQAQSQTPGQDYQLLSQLELQLPIDAAALQVGDEVTVTASGDPQLVGAVLVVRDLAVKSEATARRIGVTRRTS